MIYKNSQHIYKQVAEKLNLPLELIEAVGTYTWKEANDIISNYKHRELYMYGFGTWRFRKMKAQKYVERSEKVKQQMLKLYPEEEPRNKVLENINYKLRIYQKFIDDWDNIIELRKEKSKIKNEYKANKRSIQEQRQDLGGIEEQSIQE